MAEQHTVRTYLGNVDPGSARFPFIAERNGSIAQKIAEYQGFTFNPEPLMGFPQENTYLVPGTTLAGPQRTKFLIHSVEDFYGGMVPELSYVGKAILHPTQTPNRPRFHENASTFTQQIGQKQLVLPGVTIFSADDGLVYFDEVIAKEKPLSYRLKTPNDSDGEGQAAVENREHLAYLLTKHDARKIAQEGLVLEKNLIGPKHTISAGTFTIGTDKYSFIADQQNGKAEDGRDVYLGAHGVRIVRGNLANLLVVTSHHMPQDGIHIVTLNKVKEFDETYRNNIPIVASRLSYDMLIGMDTKGNPIAGITDITARLGGTCPILILGALDLQANPSYEAVVGEVNLNYAPEETQAYEHGATVFMDQEPLRITAKINSVI